MKMAYYYIYPTTTKIPNEIHIANLDCAFISVFREENMKERDEKEVLTDNEAPGEEDFEVSELDEDDDDINELLKDIPK